MWLASPTTYLFNRGATVFIAVPPENTRRLGAGVAHMSGSTAATGAVTGVNERVLKRVGFLDSLGLPRDRYEVDTNE